MDCFHQASRIAQPAYFNSTPLMYGYGMPTYYSTQFFSLGRSSEIRRPPVSSGSPLFLGESAPTTVTSSEGNTSPLSTASPSPPESPSESSAELSHKTACSREANDEPCQSAKDASESEEKTGTISLLQNSLCAKLNTCI